MDASIYPSIRRTLHWLIAFAIVGMIASGVIMTDIGVDRAEDRALRAALFDTHKWCGLAVLALIVVRVLAAVIWRGPAIPAHISTAERRTASVVHALIYALLLATPLLGWAAVSAGGFLPSPIFGALEAPALLPRYDCDGAWTLEGPGVSMDIACLPPERFFDAHWLAAYALGGLTALHVLAALSHLIRADGVFRRMWFRRSS